MNFIHIVRITLVGKNHKIGRIYKVFKLLADFDINVDIIVQAFGEHKAYEFHS